MHSAYCYFYNHWVKQGHSWQFASHFWMETYKLTMYKSFSNHQISQDMYSGVRKYLSILSVHICYIRHQMQDMQEISWSSWCWTGPASTLKAAQRSSVWLHKQLFSTGGFHLAWWRPMLSFNSTGYSVAECRTVLWIRPKCARTMLTWREQTRGETGRSSLKQPDPAWFNISKLYSVDVKNCFVDW